MKLILYFFSAILLSLAYLLPYHVSPWPTFGSEILTLLSGLVLVLAIAQKKIIIPKPQILAIPILAIPIVQFAFGQIIYLSNTLACFIYIMLFWLMIIAGYNLSLTAKAREKFFNKMSLLLLVVGLVSSLIAIFQWLNISSYFSPLMFSLRKNRPYANLAQPNNLATLLTMALLACLYFYEKHLIRNRYLAPYALILIFSIALTQSRTSWVVCLFILIYWLIKQFNQKKRMHALKLGLWVGVFVLCISSLPFLNQIVSAFGMSVPQTDSVVERATSGYMRLDMWSQVLVALQQNPWLGYGWNQTGMAQIAAFDLYPSHEWYKSAHNIVLDLLVWNGILIGVLIIGYLAIWLYWLNKGVKDTISIIATLMVCAILIHGMLEYPLHYAYFLLPAGLLLGIIQAQYSRLPSINFNSKLLVIISIIGIVGTLITVRDYYIYREQSYIVNQKNSINADQRNMLDKDILLLTQFEERVWWVQLNPRTKISDHELAYIGRMVANLASRYDVYKYAQVLAFNGKKAEAEHQLWILSELHGKNHRYEDLLK